MWRAAQAFTRPRVALCASRRFLRQNRRRSEDRQRLQLSNSFQLARRAGDRSAALDALRTIRSNGFSLKSNEVLDMMVLCAKDAAVDDAVDLLRSVRNLESGGHVRVLNTHIWNAVLMAVDSVHDPDRAWEVFRELQADERNDPDELSHHIVMSTAIQTGQWQLALKLLGLLRQSSVLRPQPFSYFLAVTGVAVVGELKMLKSLLTQSVKDGVPPEMEMLDEAMQYAQSAEQPGAVEILQTFAEKHRAVIEEREKMREQNTGATVDIEKLRNAQGRLGQPQAENPLENILRAAEQAREHGLPGAGADADRKSIKQLMEEGEQADMESTSGGGMPDEEQVVKLLSDAAANSEELAKIEQMDEEEFEKYITDVYGKDTGGSAPDGKLDDVEKELLFMEQEMARLRKSGPDLDPAEGILPEPTISPGAPASTQEAPTRK